jgi:hypothetical protein
LWFYNYSVAQLEKIAEDKLREFDSERLTIPKGIDVYDFIETCLDVPYEWKNLTPMKYRLFDLGLVEGGMVEDGSILF